MDNKEKKIIEDLDYMTGDVEVPESLQPEAVEKLLREHKSDKKELHKKKFQWKRSYTRAAAAAAFLVVVGAAAGGIAQIKKTGAVPDYVSDYVPGLDNSMKKADGVIEYAPGYDKIYEYIQARAEQYEKVTEEFDYDTSLYTGARTDNEMAAAESVGSTAKTQSDSGHSSTNVRTEGVDEGDIVKTDGEYLYVLKDTLAQINIVDIRGEEMKVADTLTLENGMQGTELYVQGDRLIVLGVVQEESEKLEIGESVYQEKTCALTYDISDRTNAKEIGRTTQSGSYESSRIVDNYLYIFSNFYVTEDCGKDEVEKYVPEAGGELIPAERIILPPQEIGNMYYVVSTVNLEEPDKVVDSKGIFHNGGITYVGKENIYFCETSRDDEGSVSTCIKKISYRDGKLEGEASGNIEGRLNDSFSIDEYNGYLRMVVIKDDMPNEVMPLLREDMVVEDQEKAEEVTSTNAVYVLDKDLKIVGSIEDLAPDEKIYSARFMGDTAYFVTFKQVDPLFSVDLSDPTKPEIIGSLKIPGFSEYLHPYGDGLLLGIGMDVDEEGVTTNGVKLSMFDISDPSNVKEIHKAVLEGVYGSSALYDYKSVLIDEEKNMIGFSAYGEQESYYMFEYDKESGFRKCMEEDVNNTSWMSTKGLYSGDQLYVVGGNVIESYQIPTYEKTGDIILP